MVGDDWAIRVKHGHDALQWEPFVSLHVQEWRECTGKPRAGVGGSERSRNRNRPWGDMGSGPAGSQPAQQGCDQNPFQSVIRILHLELEN